MARDETFLGRWSRRKREQESKAQTPQPAEAKPAKAEEAPAVPRVEDLTPQSDFSLFMHPKVQDSVRRVALKKLFSDPQFNVPDPFEPFSGDWTVGEPIPKELMEKLHQARTHAFSDEERQRLEEADARQAAERAAQEEHASAPQVQEKEVEEKPADEKLADEKQDEPRGKDA